MRRGFFVTGTDTGVGKTITSLGLMRALQSQGQIVTAMKPVASGCESSPSGLVNADARRLQAQGSLREPYEQVNPYAFAPPIAPHLAAASAGVSIQIAVIERAYKVLADQADAVVVEGVGGWLVPINAHQTMADVAVALGLPVIIVVAIRLGCLNHALLTAGAVRRAGLDIAGWVANRIDPACLNPADIVQALGGWIDAPLLADVAYQSDGRLLERQARQIDLGRLPG